MSIEKLDPRTLQDTGTCYVHKDKTHCACWWDGEPCCACGWTGGDTEEGVPPHVNWCPKQKAKDENARLRAAIKDAPCPHYEGLRWKGTCGDCECWKRKALECRRVG